MPSVPLPERASLEHLKKQAKLLQGLVAAGDAGALDLVAELDPGRDGSVRFRRADAQRVVARLYGARSWTDLRAQLRQTDDLTRADPADLHPDGAEERFVTLGCVSYADHDPLARLRLANELLEADPGLATASVAAMATAGDHSLLAEHVQRHPASVDDPCGPCRWPPLLYCAFSRIEHPDPAWSTLRAAEVLLDAGADPNAGFLWRGLVPPFTALTGALGRGEADQPPHRHALALARLLLEAGADPNDGQALYNNGLAGTATDDPGHLELLVEFGLGTDAGGPWYQRFGSRLTGPAELLADELEVAALRGLPNRMRTLADLGLDLRRPVGRSRRTPWAIAQLGGHAPVLAVLAEFGVTDGEPS